MHPNGIQSLCAGQERSLNHHTLCHKQTKRTLPWTIHLCICVCLIVCTGYSSSLHSKFINNNNFCSFVLFIVFILTVLYVICCGVESHAISILCMSTVLHMAVLKLTLTLDLQPSWQCKTMLFNANLIMVMALLQREPSPITSPSNWHQQKEKLRTNAWNNQTKDSVEVGVVCVDRCGRCSKITATGFEGQMQTCYVDVHGNAWFTGLQADVVNQYTLRNLESQQRLKRERGT